MPTVTFSKAGLVAAPPLFNVDSMPLPELSLKSTTLPKLAELLPCTCLPLNTGLKTELHEHALEAYPLARARRAVIELINGLHVQLRVALRVHRRAPLLGQQLAQVRGGQPAQSPAAETCSRSP